MVSNQLVACIQAVGPGLRLLSKPSPSLGFLKFACVWLSLALSLKEISTYELAIPSSAGINKHCSTKNMGPGPAWQYSSVMPALGRQS